MFPAFRVIVLFAHLHALLTQHGLCALPMQCFLLLRTIVQQVHAQLLLVNFDRGLVETDKTHSDVNTHFLEGLLTRFPIDHIITHVPCLFEFLERVIWEERTQPCM